MSSLSCGNPGSNCCVKALTSIQSWDLKECVRHKGVPGGECWMPAAVKQEVSMDPRELGCLEKWAARSLGDRATWES